MTETEQYLILATLAGPIIAVQTQKWIERANERRLAHRRIFYALMATRATRASQEHVTALNMIDLEFQRPWWRFQTPREKIVVDSWHEYADHLNIDMKNATEAARTAWNIKCYDLFIDLLYALSRALHYNFEKSEIRKGVYYPEAHGEAELRKLDIEQGLVRLLRDGKPLSMKVLEFPVSDEAYDLQKRAQEAFIAAAADGAITVKRAP